MFGIDAPADFHRPSRFLRGVKITLVVASAAWLAATTTARAPGVTKFARMVLSATVMAALAGVFILLVLWVGRALSILL